jgi:hypothetical protein
VVPRPLAYTSHKRGITIHLRPTHHVSIRLLHSTIRQHFSKAQKHQSHAPSCLRIRFRLELARRLPQPLLEGLDGTGVVPTLPLALHAMFRGSRCYMEMIRAVRIDQCRRPNSLSALCICPPTTVRSRAIVISSFAGSGAAGIIWLEYRIRAGIASILITLGLQQRLRCGLPPAVRGITYVTAEGWGQEGYLSFQLARNHANRPNKL